MWHQKWVLFNHLLYGYSLRTGSRTTQIEFKANFVFVVTNCSFYIPLLVSVYQSNNKPEGNKEICMIVNAHIFSDIHNSIPNLSWCFFTLFSFDLLLWILLSFLQDRFVYQNERKSCERKHDICPVLLARKIYFQRAW